MTRDPHAPQSRACTCQTLAGITIAGVDVAGVDRVLAHFETDHGGGADRPGGCGGQLVDRAASAMGRAPKKRAKR